MASKNLQVRLASRPSGEPTLENFEIVEAEIPTPQAGQMLLRAIYLSLDPYMRGRMNADSVKSVFQKAMQLSERK
jgi:NADPH-dependent curcumin reductase CurA